MIKWLRWTALVLLVALPLSGCTILRLYATTGNKISLTETNSAGGESFTIEHRRIFDYTGAFDVQEMLRERYGSGNDFQNVSVKAKYDLIDFLLNLVTLGIARSVSFEVTGDVIRRSHSQ